MTEVAPAAQGGLIPHAPAEEPDDFHDLEEVIATSKRVGKRIGVHVDTHDLEDALATRERLIAARRKRGLFMANLAQQGVKVLDSEAERRYQAKRLRRTVGECYVAGWKQLSTGVRQFMLHGWTGTVMAVLSFMLVSMACFHILPRYDSDGQGTILAMLILGSIFPTAFSGLIFDNMRFPYAVLPYLLLGLPFQLIAWTISPLWAHGDSGRKYEVLKPKQFFGGEAKWGAPTEIMANVYKAIPRAKLRFEVLMNPDGTRNDDVLLTIDVDGVESEKIYVWHDLV